MDRNRAKIGVICGAEKADGMFSGADCLSLGLSKRLLAKSTSISRGSVTLTGVTETCVPELVGYCRQLSIWMDGFFAVLTKVILAKLWLFSQ